MIVEKKSSFRNFLISRILPPGQIYPTVPFVCLFILIVTFLQLPANIFIKSVSITAGIFINEVLIIAAVPIIASLLLKFDTSKLFPFTRPSWSSLIYVAILTIPMALLIDYGVAASELILPLPARYHDFLERITAYSGPAEFTLKIFTLCVLPGICEEILFRGFIQTSLEIKLGKTIAIVMTAILFAILHGNPWYVHLYFALGLFLSWVYATSRTLTVPIVCHTINNLWTFINHAGGVKYPLKNFSDPLDIAIIACAIALCVIFGMKFQRKRKTCGNT